VLANVRWVTDRRAVTSAQADNWIANTHRQNQHALRFGRFGEPTCFGDPLFSACSARRKRYSPRKPGGRLPTLRFPTRLGVPSKLVRFPNAQRRAGRPRSSPSPLRGNCRLPPTLVVWYIDTFSAPIVGEYADATARRSVTYLDRVHATAWRAVVYLDCVGVYGLFWL
jgi:hypothetical protein